MYIKFSPHQLTNTSVKHVHKRYRDVTALNVISRSRDAIVVPPTARRAAFRDAELVLTARLRAAASCFMRP